MEEIQCTREKKRIRDVRKRKRKRYRSAWYRNEKDSDTASVRA